MGWIRDRILSEHRKYGNFPEMDWARIAEAKIKGQLKEDGNWSEKYDGEKDESSV